ncbi:MAG: YaiI/YqxD family protein [Deltaproteobacteria bacterium]|nr:YaiI/YqxD family protein [Deltaproteobacteria bacterium]
MTEPDFKIWIDADGCPRPVKDTVFRASDRLQIPVVLVADRPLGRQPSPRITSVVVPRDMDSADRHIVEQVGPGDLVITADLPLAAAVVESGAVAINPRGETYTEENVRERLSMRDFLMGLRETGQEVGGPPPYSRKDKERFAAALDRFLTRRLAG